MEKRGNLLFPTSGVQSPTKTVLRNATVNKLKKKKVHLEFLLSTDGTV